MIDSVLRIAGHVGLRISCIWQVSRKEEKGGKNLTPSARIVTGHGNIIIVEGSFSFFL